MHKGVLMLTKAPNAETAKENVRRFMPRYDENVNGIKRGVWDWWVFGGRWSGMLPQGKLNKEMLEKYHAEAEQRKLCYMGKEKELAALFTEYFPDFPGVPPAARDQYQNEGYPDDVAPLSEYLDLVKDWRQDHEREIARNRENIRTHFKRDHGMKAYCRKCIRLLKRQKFCFDSSVHNIDDNNAKIPKNPDGWWIVIIDMHD